MKDKKIYSCLVKENQVSSPLGPWLVTTCDLGLHSVKLSKEVTNENFLELGREQINLYNKTEIPHFLQLENWMQQYFSLSESKNAQPEPHICKHILPPDWHAAITFRQNAWSKLKDNVRYGETISYKNLAKLCSVDGKSSSASRAVGGAMANNPISLIVPCHRVINSNGGAGNYSKCTKNDVKLWLLRHEQQTQ